MRSTNPYMRRAKQPISRKLKHSWQVLKDWAALAESGNEFSVAMASRKERKCDADGVHIGR